MSNINQIKQLREETGVSITECKKALEETAGDKEKAKEVLRQWGRDLANKKITRETKEGIVDCYIHPNKKIGAFLELRCESDFVAKSNEFKELAHELCLQIVATNPLFLSDEKIPENFLNNEQRIYQEQFKDCGKPQKIIDQIIQGKLKKYKEEVLLLSQPWIKDETKTIKNLIEDYVAKIGENIVIANFARYQI